VALLAILAGIFGPMILRTNTIVRHRKDEGLTEEQLVTRLHAAQQDFDAGKWTEARAAFEQIRVATEGRESPVRTQAINYLDRLGREQAAADVFQKIKDSQDAGRMEDALALYESSQASLKDTRAEGRLSELGPQLRQAAVAGFLEQARKAVKEHKLDEASHWSRGP